MARRGIALGGGLLVLILLVLGVRGCLDARKERALKDYARDVSQIVDETAQTSERSSPGSRTPATSRRPSSSSEINADRSAMDSYLSRVEGLDVPGDMSRAQNGLELVYQLRASALGTIAQRVGFALGRRAARRRSPISPAEMRTLLASDVLYEDVVRPEINGVLAGRGHRGQRPAGKPVPPGRHSVARREHRRQRAGSGERRRSRDHPRTPRHRPDRDDA